MIIELFWSPLGLIKWMESYLDFISVKVTLAVMGKVVNLHGYAYLKAHPHNLIIFWDDEFRKSLKNYHYCFEGLIIVLFAVINETF